VAALNGVSRLSAATTNLGACRDAAARRQSRRRTSLPNGSATGVHMRSVPSRSTRTGRRGVAVRTGVVAVAAALTAAGGAGVASAAPASVTGGPASRASLELDAAQVAEVRAQLARREATRPAGLPASGPQAFFLELDTPSTSQVYADALTAGGGAAAAAAATQARPAAEAAAQGVIGDLSAAVPRAEVLYATSTVLSGVAVSADAADHDALSAMPGVAAVRQMTPKTVANTGAAAVVQARQVWQDLGNTGAGVSIGVIDTGIDYTHTDFGGSGNVEEYRALRAASAQPAPAGVFPNAKVVGGRDFVGDTYDPDPASPAFDPVPRPDDNPLDCNGHGTHVAGTAGGYGVNADGSTFRGGYDAVPEDLRIGPGMAPEAELYALKVFGCEGSTLAVLQAVEWAVDPNGDGDPSDHLDVINVSIGQNYGVPDDPEAVAVDRAAELGVIAVLSAGNAGDVYDVGGSPGNAPRSIAVAATNDGYGVFDGWRVVAPPGLLEGVRPGMRSAAFTDTDESGALRPDVTGDLIAAPAESAEACSPLPAGYATGRILLIQAAGFVCGSAVKGANAAAAGAIGFVIVSGDDLLENGITGVPEIPGILVTNSDGQAAASAVAAGQTVTVTFGPSLRDASVFSAPEQVDLVATFTSRGVRQESGVKPDVAAPGATLYSAGFGEGSGGTNTSGTSMASPVTAGVSALVRAAHPDWTTEDVKAAVVNTATHDVFTGPGQTGQVYGPNRVGAGRIDAPAAVSNTVLAYAEAGSGVVSASFGVVEVAEPQVTATKTLTVANKGEQAAVYGVAYDALADQPGVEYTLSESTVTVPPGETRTVTVTMTAVRDQLLKVPDPTVVTDSGRQFLGEESGRIVLTPSDGQGSELRVPVHSNAKPSSTLTATPSEDGGTITLTGQGVANGPALEPQSYTSLVSAFEQLGASPALPLCETAGAPGCYVSELERSVDVAAVGVASDVAQFPDDPALYFAVSAHGTAATPAAWVTYNVHVDGNGDGLWDYLVTTIRLPALDLPLVVVRDRDLNLLPSNDAPFVAPLNLADGSVDTNVFDTDVQVMGVPLSVLPLVQGRIAFGVMSFSGSGSVDDVGTTTDPETFATELSDPMSFDPLRPGLSFSGPGGVPALLVPASDGTTLTVTPDPEAHAADVAIGGADKGAMVVLPHNDSATGRTQQVPIDVGTPVPVPAAVG
jgi:subtilisin family serine protease